MQGDQFFSASVIQSSLEAPVHPAHRQPVRLVEVRSRTVMLQLAIFDDECAAGPVPIDRQTTGRAVLAGVSDQPVEQVLPRTRFTQCFVAQVQNVRLIAVTTTHAIQRTDPKHRGQAVRALRSRGQPVGHGDDVPEGDSVYRLARRLDAGLRGQVLERTSLRVPRHATANLDGLTLLEHDTHGKHLLTRLSEGLTLHTHLRMQGSWTVTRPGKWLPRRVMPDVRVVLGAASGATAYGISLPVVELLRTRDERQVVGHLGPDPLRADWDPAEAVRRMSAAPDRPVVAALLDQRVVAGFGNLWANELCFLVGVSPWTPVGEVDVERLVALGARALTISATVEGAHQVTTGRRQRGERHWVAGRYGRPCLRCGTRVLVAAEVTNDPENRRTWWCPHCQPGPARPAPMRRPPGT